MNPSQANIFAIGEQKPHSTMYDCIQEFIGQYWANHADQQAWLYFSHPVFLMNHTVKVSTFMQDQPPVFLGYDIVDLDDYNEQNCEGRLAKMTPSASQHCYYIEVVEDEEHGYTVTAKLDNDFLAGIARSAIGKNVCATFIDSGDGPRLTDIEVNQ